MKQKFYFSFKMSEKYKYTSKGKTYTYDLSSLTDEEKKKFHKMSHTNRLRFIEQHKLEEVPLFDTYTVRTAAESTDKKKRWKKEMDLYNSQFIKNGLEEMKNKGKALDGDTLKKKFSDEQYKDIEKRIKEGYNDFDKLINYYVNQINTLNVESIDTMNTKNLNELKAEQINKLVFDTKQLDKLLKDPINQLIKLQELDKIKDNVKALEAIDSGNITSLINELKNMKLDGIVDNINNKINTALNQLKEITKIDVEKGELLKVLGNKDDRVELKDMIEELKKQRETVNNLIEKYNKSEMTKEQLEENLKQNGIPNEEIKEILGRIEQDVKSLSEFETARDNIIHLVRNNVPFNDLFNEMYKAIYNIINIIVNKGGKKSMIIFSDVKNYGLGIDADDNKIYLSVNGEKKDMSSTDDNKKWIITFILDNYKNAYIDSTIPNSIILIQEFKSMCELFANLLSKYYEKDWSKAQPQQGQGIEGGSFKNRFKDFTPDINKLNDKIERLQNEVNELKKVKAETKPLEIPVKKIDFLSQIRDKPVLKPVKDMDVQDEVNQSESNEYKPLLDILKKRREDIEYSDTEDEDNDDEWGEGVKNKSLTNHGKRIYKFSELFY